MGRFNIFNFDEKTKMLIKIALITVGTVYGGHKLVQFVSPSEEDILKVFKFVFLNELNYLTFLFRDFLKSEEIII